MLGRKQELNLQSQKFLDGLLCALAFWGAHRLRLSGADWSLFDRPIGPFADFQWLLFIIIPFGPILLELQGFYLNPLLKAPGKSLRQIIRSAFWLGLLLAACSYFIRLQIPSRAVMPLFAVLGTSVLLLRERFTIARLRRKALSESLREPVVLFGTPEDLQQLRQNFTGEQAAELEVVREFNVKTYTMDELLGTLHEHSVSRVIFTGGFQYLQQIQDAILACETEGVEAWLMTDFIRTSIARPTFDVFANRPTIVFRTTPDLSWALLIKSFIDRVGAFCGLVLAFPILLIIAAAIKLTSPGPVLFLQKRGGKHGRPFTMFKFRSMHSNAEMQQADLRDFNQMTGPVFKIADDPRVNRLGRFLRRTSLDELPQLYNVLRGEMSLVGPRPLPLYELKQFQKMAQRRRLSMKPGLTCLWQISGRNQVNDFDTWVQLDLQYIDNWSLELDLSILLRTIPAVLSGLGAR